MTTLKIELTDHEWIDLLDREGEGLPMCCANISGLRDEIRYMLENGRTVNEEIARSFNMRWNWCFGGQFPGHDLPNSPAHKIHDQIVAVFGDNK